MDSFEKKEERGTEKLSETDGGNERKGEKQDSKQEWSDDMRRPEGERKNLGLEKKRFLGLLEALGVLFNCGFYIYS